MTRLALDAGRGSVDPWGVIRHPRHFWIWTAVGTAHLMAVSAVVWSGVAGGEGLAPKGGVLVVELISEPMAWAGEVPQGEAVGAGRLQNIIAPVLWQVAPSLEVVVGSSAVASPIAATPASNAPAVPLAPTLSAAPEIFEPVVFLQKVDPVYPERAHRFGLEGQVAVRLKISAEGQVLQAVVQTSSGNRWLDEAAVGAAQASRFKPAQLNGKAVTADAEAVYRFELR